MSEQKKIVGVPCPISMDEFSKLVGLPDPSGLYLMHDALFKAGRVGAMRGKDGKIDALYINDIEKMAPSIFHVRVIPFDKNSPDTEDSYKCEDCGAYLTRKASEVDVVTHKDKSWCVGVLKENLEKAIRVAENAEAWYVRRRMLDGDPVYRRPG